MSNINSTSKQLSFIDNKRLLATLILVLITITLLYQSNSFFDNESEVFTDTFSVISAPTYLIIPAVLVGYSIIITIKLLKQKSSQAKVFLLFAIGASCWFAAEQIWQMYDYSIFVEGDPFPSEADIFYLLAYPFFFTFLLFSLKPIRKSISRNVWLFAIGLSFSFLIPAISGLYPDIFDEEPFTASILLAYPILASFQLVPAIIGVMFLAKKSANLAWMLILFGFIMYAVADTFFVFAELNDSYYDGHPVDVMYLYSYVMLIFALHIRFKLTKILHSEKQTMFFSENIKFETISNFGIPLTVAIVCMVILISLINTVIFETDEQLSAQSLMLGIVAMLGVFVTIVITLNRNLSRLVRMRTHELVEQRDNLENLVEEKTHEVLKSERLSAIGELSGRLAHDLRNPLSVMKMSVDLLKQNSDDSKVSDPIVAKRIDLIEKSIERISHQVDDVLGYVRNSPLKLSNISVRKLVEASIEKINVPNDVELKIYGEDVKIDCDSVKLEAVFINLIVNSIQAMHEGGKIEIQIKEDGNMVVLEFIDSGDGIPVDDIDKIFEPLFTTKQKGTGLGLASCRNIVEQHQGEIYVENNPTTFTISLLKSLTVLLPQTKNN